MNIGNIVTPNTKGQIVIPQKIRESLGIDENTPLQMIQSGKSLILHPIKNIIRDIDQEESYIDILKKTVGAWTGDDWPKMRKRRKKIEIAAANKRKTTAW